MGNIIYINGERTEKFTNKSDFLKGLKKPLSQFKHDREVGYFFPWGILTETHRNYEEEDTTDKFLIFGIRWSEPLKRVCNHSGMTDPELTEATLTYLPGGGESGDTWCENFSRFDSGAIYTNLTGESGLSEKKLRDEIWNTYLIDMDSVVIEIMETANRKKSGRKNNG